MAFSYYALSLSEQKDVVQLRNQIAKRKIPSTDKDLYCTLKNEDYKDPSWVIHVINLRGQKLIDSPAVVHKILYYYHGMNDIFGEYEKDYHDDIDLTYGDELFDKETGKFNLLLYMYGHRNINILSNEDKQKRDMNTTDEQLKEYITLLYRISSCEELTRQQMIDILNDPINLANIEIGLEEKEKDILLYVLKSKYWYLKFPIYTIEPIENKLTLLIQNGKDDYLSYYDDQPFSSYKYPDFCLTDIVTDDDLEKALDFHGAVPPLYHNKLQYYHEYFINRVSSLFKFKPNMALTEIDIIEYMHHFTDKELIEMCDIDCYYDSGKMLPDALTDIMYTDTYRLPPYFFQSITYKYCKEKETSLYLESISSDNKDAELICYGHYNDYVVYSKEELLDSFKEVDGAMRFSYPDNPKRVFTGYDIFGLYKLFNYSDSICECIRPYLRTTIFQVNMYKDDVFSLSEEDQSIIKNILYIIYELGLYFRGWNGVKGNYPVREYETYNEVKEEKIYILMIELSEKINSLSKEGYNAFENISSYYISEDENKENYSLTISSCIDQVFRSEYCIRELSKLFIDSANILLKEIYDTNVSDKTDMVYEFIY